MKFTWKGKWREGEITVEAETFEELDNAIKSLLSTGGIKVDLEAGNKVPEIPSEQGCAGAIREMMKSEWGRQPRSMSEIKKVLDANALYFSKGTLSGALATMTKRGELRRVKEEGRWKYLSK